MKSLDILKNVLVEKTNKKLYLTEITKKLKATLAAKFKKEKPDLTDDMINYYIDGFERFKRGLPPEERDITKYTFANLENLIDARTARKELKKSSSKKITTGVEDEDAENLIYNDNNLKVFRGPTKDYCIKYGQGQATWCISRPGGSNLFYNYRYGHNLTIYFIFDDDMPRNNVNGGMVILVEPDGDVRLADRSNSGRYSGHQVVPWSDILQKQPKLKGLEKLFKPQPLTAEEKKEYSRLKSTRVGENPYESLDRNWEDVEKWLEFNSPTLTDKQYESLISPLKKKYIALGFDLTPGQIGSSDSDVIKYYKKKKLEKILKSSLSQLSKEDIALLSHPSMTEAKMSLQPKFLQDLGKNNQNEIEINYPEGDSGKYAALYGFDDIFDHLPKSITKLSISNKSNQPMSFDVPSKLGEYTEITALQFTNCLKSLPEEISNLTKLNFLVIPNNPDLKRLPASIDQMDNVHFINLTGTPAKLPPATSERMNDEGGGFYWTVD
jgi:hypothetical protein